MDLSLDLTEDETAALRDRAAVEGRSMEEVARSAIAQYVCVRPSRLLRAVDRVRNEDAELLHRLAQ